MTGIRELFRLGYTPPAPGASSPRTKAPPSVDSTFSTRLERYLDDVQKGRAPLFDSVPTELSRKASRAANELADTNPKALLLSSAYSTALEYDRKARFVSQTADSALRLSTLYRA